MLRLENNSAQSKIKSMIRSQNYNQHKTHQIIQLKILKMGKCWSRLKSLKALENTIKVDQDRSKLVKPAK